MALDKETKAFLETLAVSMKNLSRRMDVVESTPKRSERLRQKVAYKQIALAGERKDVGANVSLAITADKKIPFVSIGKVILDADGKVAKGIGGIGLVKEDLPTIIKGLQDALRRMSQ